MKLSNRAKSALATAGYPVNETSAIAQLVAFAAQNSGIEPANYGSWQSLKQEQRSISEDWRRVKQALNVAAIEGVKDEDVIAEAPHAFSGRLEWRGDDIMRPPTNCPKCNGEREWDYDASGKQIAKCHFCGTSTPTTEGHWSYCTGQYFPTEYRKAAATLLEYATRRVRQARPPEKRERITTIAELKALNVKNGGCWFNPGEMRFFGTRIESEIIGGKYFISSEQPPHGSRKYSVRSFNDEGKVGTVGEFCSHHGKADAMEALREHMKNEQVPA